MVVVGVECLRTVAILQIAAQLELVVAQFSDVVITVGLLTADLFKKTSAVVGVGDLLLVGINHLDESVMAVVSPLGKDHNNKLL